MQGVRKLSIPLHNHIQITQVWTSFKTLFNGTASWGRILLTAFWWNGTVPISAEMHILYSVTRFGDLLDFGQLLKPFNWSKSITFLVKYFLGNFYRHLAIFSGHTDSVPSKLWPSSWISLQPISFNKVDIKINEIACFMLAISVTRKKSPNVYKTCPKMISLEKW